MDIQVSSNFERLLFDAGGRDGAAMAEQMRAFEASKAMHLTNAQAEGAAALFTSARADQVETARALQWAYRAAGQVIDPHTGVGLHCALGVAEAGIVAAGVPLVTLATAHPAKFPDAVERAIGVRPSLPARVGDLFGRAESYVELAGDYATTRDHVLGNAAGAGAA
jgi:threonine synthase